ncbi:MAG: MFS transporter [Candidatus Hermodarchaeota archaeon]
MAIELNNDEKMENWKSYYLWLEGLFYFFQGFYFMGFQIYISVYTAQIWVLPYQTIAMVTAVMMIPAYIKMFTGLLSDRVPIGPYGRRKPYLVFGGLLYIPAFILLVLIQDFSVIWIFVIMLVMGAWVLVDGTLDALTVDITPDEYAKSMQSSANAGRYLGMALGSILVGLLAPIISWPLAVILIGIFATFQVIVTMFIKEPPSMGDIDQLPLGTVLRETFGHSRSWLGFLFSLVFMGAFGMGALLGPYMLQDIGLDTPTYGILIFIGSLGTVIGAMGFGIISRKIEVSPRIYWIVTIIAWILVTPWLLVNQAVALPYLALANLSLGIARGMITVLTYIIVMKLCPKSIEGFMFATLTSFMNIGLAVLAPNLVAFFEPYIGMMPALFFLVPFSIVGLLLVPKLLESPPSPEKGPEHYPELE